MVTANTKGDECDPFGAELTEQADRYAHGDCHILASVLNALTGWPIHAGVTEDMWSQKTCLVHAWVAMPDGRAMEAHGASEPKDLLLQYPDGDRAEVVLLTNDAVMRLGSGRKVMSQKRRKEAEEFASKLLAEWDPDKQQNEIARISSQ
jgi:hypothetical protein